MKIAVDGMGGDNSPRIVVEGSIQALKEFEDLQIIITGKQDEINKELSKYEYDKNKITVVNATEVIDTNDHPVMAIRRKKDSSLVKALNLVKNNEADAIISAGSTGAFMAGSLFIVGRINGIDRPAIAPIMPGKNGKFMVVDCGANVDCKPNNLVQFAHMGKIYFENVLGVKNPSIGLVNIGVEEEKGNELTKATYKLLKNEAINFVGNIEPRDVPLGNTDIVVCDGFVGNTILKMYEGVSSSIFDVLKSEIMSSTRTKIGGFLLKPIFKEFKTKFDYKEYGGAAFIGVKGICIKAHGSSDGKALKNAIKQAILFYDNKIIEKISNEIESL
ncbi:phosphate acyltransferase PlsX [Clostridium algidicarnis]|uniref:phosphate acyltransferase PlsX n=1 Tax=Clostridium algidicarnis TaxID=37659 RepID=UPI001C0DE674|nr:phosphate acyltransferase PlsX [Clostridium algidicarnis]MBU3195553.1 phosphate acyltransferase PlsX [Clostridium algidicarnis]MBU3208601.1 phosphate acyltransferase PlsX [Clostridium algidicarnis]MBU3226892.1 phosphate acyltransferase PlsX [Clostridium algidicarnis]MBU3250197.1 phosphate acyltransferase PlsX [Clostridium algidicarnis]